MTRGRYLGIAWDGAPNGRQRDAQDLLRGFHGFEAVLEEPHCTIIAEPSLPVAKVPGGVVLGPIFKRGDDASVERFTVEEGRGLLSSEGALLTTRFWGSYVAAFSASEGERMVLVKSPFGELPCYFTRCSQFTAFASDVGLLRSAGLFRAAVDWDAMARHLAQSELRWSETCLAGLVALPSGTKVSTGADTGKIRPLWSPWPHAAPERQVRDRRQAAKHLHDVVCSCVSVLAAPYEHTLLLLSGGLDSSIVAAALARARARLTCLTLVGDDPAGDERAYAQLTAGAVGVPLVEAHRRDDVIDITRSSASGMPFPSARSFTQEADIAVLELAGRVGAEAVFDGGGGDNVFYGLLSAAAAADCLRAGGPDARFWSTVRSLADLAQTGLWRVAQQAAYRAWLRSSTPRLTLNTHFLSPRGKEALIGWEPHPWLHPPPRTRPGKASQVALLAPAQGLVEAADPLARIRSIMPLVAQPIVETCLGIPAWHWFAPGWNRAAARLAFKHALPVAVIDRRSKGTPNAFVAALYERHRGLIREMLLDGCIAEHGLLDRAKIRQVLDMPGPARGFEFARILELVDAEAWARSWS